MAWTAVVLLFLVARVSAQSSSCTTAVIGLAPCLSFISGNGTTPSTSCCSQLASVVKAEPQCLCTVLNGGGAQFGLSINQSQALALPGACKVQTPPVSQCKSVAAGEPTASPASTTPSTPSAPSTPQGSGSKVTPPATGTSDGSSTKMPFSLVFSVLFLGAIAH